MELLLGVSGLTHAWHLMPQRALFCPAASTLVVADVHLGKAASFRALAVPVPAGTTAANLTALDGLLTATGARRLIFLGDLFHAAAAHGASQREALSAWRVRHRRVQMVLVEGNHDARAGRPDLALRIEVVEEPYACAGAQLCHHPQRRAGEVVIAGHMHPCIHLQGRGRDGLRLPCFWLTGGLARDAAGGSQAARPDDAVVEEGALLILPAFGRFTGGARLTREPGDRVFAVAAEQVFEIPPVAAGRATAGRATAGRAPQVRRFQRG